MVGRCFGADEKEKNGTAIPPCLLETYHTQAANEDARGEKAALQTRRAALEKQLQVASLLI